MDPFDTTESTLPDAADITAPDSDSASTEPSVTLKELNSFLGKEFPSKETALKALRDTQVFAVTREEKIAERVRSSMPVNDMSALTAELAQVKENLFFRDNPDYADYRDTIKALGKNPADVVESEAFKRIFVDAKAGKEFKNTRTVLESNPRIAEARSTFDKAMEASKSGNTAMSKQYAAQAVIDALGIK